MKLKRILILISVMLFAGFSYKTFAAEALLSQKPEFTYEGKSLASYASMKTPEIKGSSAYAINLNSGTVVYDKNPDAKVYPASTVKLLTAIVAYENIPDLDTKITVSSEALKIAYGSVNMSLKAGEVLTARDLFYGMLVKGANDAAVQLAVHVAGSEKEFCKLMNEKAKQIGANHSNFDNVTGFHSANTYTTARDIAKIAGYLYYMPELFDMTNEARYVVPETEKNPKRTLINRNHLLSKVSNSNYFYAGAEGMSLGSTNEGGYCIVSTVTGSDSLTYLCVVMNSKEENDINYACKDIIALFDFCKSGFANACIASVNEVVCQIDVSNAVDIDKLALFPKEDLYSLLPSDFVYGEDITVETRLAKTRAETPVNSGQVFGEIVIRYQDGSVIGRTELVSKVTVDRSNLLYMMSRIERFVTSTGFKVFAGIFGFLFALYIGLSIYYNYFRKSKYTGNNLKR